MREPEFILEGKNKNKHSTPINVADAEKLIQQFNEKVAESNWKMAWNIFVELTIIVNGVPHSKLAEYNTFFSMYKSIKKTHYYFYEKIKHFKKRNRNKNQALIDKTTFLGSGGGAFDKNNPKSKHGNLLLKNYFTNIESINHFLNRSKKFARKNELEENAFISDFEMHIKKLTDLYNVMKETEKISIIDHEKDMISIKIKFDEIIPSLNSKNSIVQNESKKVKSSKYVFLKNPKKERKVTFSWKCIRFGDGYVSFDRWAGFKYPFKSSRAIFSVIKDSVIVPSGTSFVVTFDMNKSTIEEVIGLEILDEVFEILEMNDILFNYSLGDIKYFKSNIIGKITNSQVVKIFLSNKVRDSYLDFLCQKQDESYRIIPVLENRKFEANNSSISEYVFLFAFKGVSEKTYIIWESPIESRATHIFSCKNEDYAFAAQRIYDYIYSREITNKRQLLHTSEFLYFKGRVNYIGSNNHDSIQDWKFRMRKICY